VWFRSQRLSVLRGLPYHHLILVSTWMVFCTCLVNRL